MMAQCCCDLKTTVIEQAQSIKDQNTSFRIQDLQIQNSNLQQTIALNQTAAAQTATILAALDPQRNVVRTA